MVMPEYDQECDCDICKGEREERRRKAMTARLHPQEHCGHECICNQYCMCHAVETDSPCTWTECKHDTRTHSSSPAAGPVRPSMTNTMIIRCKKTDCIDYDTELCLPWKCSLAMQKHDEQIRQQAAAKERGRVIDALCKINTDDNVCKKGKNCKECMIDSLRQSTEQQEAGEE